MTQDELDEAVGRLSPTEQIIYAEAVANPYVTAPGLRVPTGRADGMTKELAKLLRLGLIHRAGKVPRKEIPRGIRPMRYARTALAEVELNRTKEEARPATRQKLRVPKTRITDHRERAKGNWSGWYGMRKRVCEEARALNYAWLQAIDWEATPEDEIFEVAEELADLRDAIDATMIRIEARQMDDATRAKIEKLRRGNGRTPEEQASFEAGARRLEKRLGT